MNHKERKKIKHNKKADVKETTLDEVINIFETTLGATHKTTKYETHIKINENKTVAWLIQRKGYIALSVFPPYHKPKWETLKIQNINDAQLYTDILKKDIDEYQKRQGNNLQPGEK